jgi:hypothetical protein
MDKSYLSELPEVAGHSHQDGRGAPITPGGMDHRGAIHVSDDDTFAMQQGANVATDLPLPRDSQVDDTAIEYLDGAMHFCPRTLGEEYEEGGYAQEGDQSYPVSGPRVTAGMRGAGDMGASPQREFPGHGCD